MHQKDVAKMLRYASAGFVTYGTHSERRTARVWIALVRDERLGITWCHAPCSVVMSASGRTNADELPLHSGVQPWPGTECQRWLPMRNLRRFAATAECAVAVANLAVDQALALVLSEVAEGYLR